ncbi:MAG: helix-turn-helix transcriptional regulator [Opitutales bacterium]|nr:helix-turn-helix transcriptional regulator [Opitutales bacterium]
MKTPRFQPGPAAHCGIPSVAHGGVPDELRREGNRPACAHVLLVLSGKGRLHRPRASRPVAKDNILLLQDARRHRLEEDARNPLNLFTLSLVERISRDAVRQCCVDGHALLESRSVARLAHVHMRRIHYEQTAGLPGSALLRRGFAQQFLGELLRWQSLGGTRAANGFDRDDPRERVRHCIDELRTTFHHPHALDEAAARAGLSTRRFSGLFRELAGESFVQYLNRLRCEFAERLLADGNRPVLSISFECGFGDLSTFYRAFRRHSGMSPARFRKRESCG